MKYSSIGVELKKKTRLSHLSQSFIFQPTGSVDFLTSDVRILRNSVHLRPQWFTSHTNGLFGRDETELGPYHLYVISIDYK